MFKNERWFDVLNSNDVNNYVNIFLSKVVKFIHFSTIIKLEISKNKELKEWMTTKVYFVLYVIKKSYP